MPRTLGGFARGAQERTDPSREVRDRGLRPDHDFGARMARGQLRIAIERRAAARLGPLLVLRDVPLHDEHPHGLPRRPRPALVGVQGGHDHPAPPQHNGYRDRADHRAGPGSSHQRHARGGRREREPDRVAARDRCVGGERRLQPRVADLKPGEAGEQRPAEPLEESPRRGKPPEPRGRVRPGIGNRSAAAEEPGARPREQGGIEREHARQQAGQPGGRADADIAILEALRDPPQSGSERGYPEEPSAPEGAAGTRAQHGAEQHGEGRHRHHDEVPGREGEKQKRPGRDARHIRPCGGSHRTIRRRPPGTISPAAGRLARPKTGVLPERCPRRAPGGSRTPSPRPRRPCRTHRRRTRRRTAC